MEPQDYAVCSLTESHSLKGYACMQVPDNPQPPLALVSGPVKLGASCAGGSALGITFDGRASPPSANRQLASCVPIQIAAGTQCTATQLFDTRSSAVFCVARLMLIMIGVIVHDKNRDVHE